MVALATALERSNGVVLELAEVKRSRWVKKREREVDGVVGAYAGTGASRAMPVRALARLARVITSGLGLWRLLLGLGLCLASSAGYEGSPGHGEVDWRGPGTRVTRW
jgi:hypothetical protein